MAIIDVNEGETETVSPSDTLRYQNINSCLTITTVLPHITRLGGHAIMIPAEGQDRLQEICDFIQTRKYADQLYIIGDIATWDANWDQIEQCQALRINGEAVADTAGMAAALGYPNAVIFDIQNWKDTGDNSFDVYFGFNQGNRKLWAVGRTSGQGKSIPNNPAW